MSDDSKRSRFSAIVEEMTGAVVPAPKQRPGQPEALRVPRVFEEVVKVALGRVDSCPKCRCVAFTLSADGTSATCRACPLPAPTYRVQWLDGAVITMSPYKCERCYQDVMLTSTVDRINVYCSPCERLSLFMLSLTEPSRVKPKVDWNGLLERVKNIKWVPTYEREIPEAYFRQRPETDAELRARVEQLSMVSLVTVFEDSKTNVRLETVEQLRNVAGLLPFGYYASLITERNRENGLRPSDEIRRTGRTTKGILYALADVVTRGARTLAVRSTTERHEKELIRYAWDLYTKCGLAAAKPLMTIKSYPTNPTTLTRDAVIYMDHVYFDVWR